MYLFESKNQDFVSVLSIVTSIVERKSTHPILSNTLISQEGASIRLTTTDLEIQLDTVMPAPQGCQDFQFTVNAKKLLDILRSFEGQAIVGFIMHDSRLSVAVGRSRYLLQTLPANLFPLVELNEQSYHTHVTLSQAELKRHLSLVYVAMAAQDFRPMLSGMLFEIENDILNFVATDIHRLALSSYQLKDDAGKGKFIIPRKTILELIRLLTTSDDPVEICLGDIQAKFIFGKNVLISKIVQGKYPDYRVAIHKETDLGFSCERTGFLKILQRASMLSGDRLKGIRLNILYDLLKITAQNAEKEEAYEEITVKYNGPELESSYNAHYLIDSLQSLDTDNIHMSFNTTNNSTRIVGMDIDSYQYHVMPLRT